MKSLFGGLVDSLNKAPVSYTPRYGTGLSQMLLGGSSRGNPEAQMRAMGNVGTLHAIISRITTATSLARWRLWKKAASGLDEDRTEITKHLALDIWNKPNPFFTRPLFVETTQQHVELVGETEWLVARNPVMRSLPLELWPVRPDRITPVPDPTEFLKGWVYSGPDGEKVPLQVDEVIQLRLPNPLDPYRGLGVVQSILVDLDSTRYSAEWNRNFFLNSAEPGGVVELDRRLSDPEWEEMNARWNEQHKGVANAHRVAMIEQGKWVNRTFTMRDMQFSELRGVSREVIREAFGFPKPLLGSVDDVNRANAEAGEVVFARWLIVPRLERIKEALNTQFLPMFGTSASGLEFDYDEIVPADREADNAEMTAKANAVKTYIDTGFDPAEVCEFLEVPEMKFEKPEPPPQLAPPGQQPAPGEDGDEQRPAADDRETRAPAARIRNEGSEPWDYDLDGVQRAWERALAQLLREWRNITAQQRRDLLAQIRDHVSGGNLEQLASLAVDSEQAAEKLAEALTEMARIGGQQVVAEAAAQGVEDMAVAAVGASPLNVVASTVAAMLASEIALTAGREALRVAATGASADDVADAVQSRISNDEIEGQAERALGSALTGAQNAGRLATFRAGPVAALYANEVMDSSTCNPCREVHGRWLGNTDGSDFTQIELTYPLGGYVGCVGAKYGNSCRGTVTGVWRSKTVDQ